MNTHEEYVTYAQAKALKELGFDWPCRFCATSEDAPNGEFWNYPTPYPMRNYELQARQIAIPAQSVACRWLREEKGIALNVEAHDGGKYHYSTIYLPNFKDKGYEWYAYHPCPLMESYEAALSAGIDRALEILTSNNTIQ